MILFLFQCSDARRLQPFTMIWEEMVKFYKELLLRYTTMWNTASDIYKDIFLSETTKEKVRNYIKRLSDERLMGTNFRAMFLRERGDIDVFIQNSERSHFHVPVLIT